MIDKMMRSIIEQDRASVVICNPEHVIVYMNPAAKIRYAKRGGAELVGKSLLNCHNEESKQIIEKVISWFGESEKNNMIHSFYNEKENKDENNEDNEENTLETYNSNCSKAASYSLH